MSRHSSDSRCFEARIAPSGVNGVFDYDGAAWADRHHDFRYLLFDVGREDMLDAALRTYEPAVERSLDRNRIRLYNSACATGYLAFRAGVPPEQSGAAVASPLVCQRCQRLRTAARSLFKA